MNYPPQDPNSYPYPSTNPMPTGVNVNRPLYHGQTPPDAATTGQLSIGNSIQPADTNPLRQQAAAIIRMAQGLDFSKGRFEDVDVQAELYQMAGSLTALSLMFDENFK